MQLACSYIYQKFGNETFYTCWVDMASIKDRGTEIDDMVGEHDECGKSNMMVKAIWFTDRVVNYFPRGLNKIFPKLEAVGIVGCDLKEISREDLEGLENMKFIYLHANKLTSLPDDLFQGMSKLKEISIIDNKELMGIRSKLFAPILSNGLNYVDLVNNGSISAYYCPGYKGTVKSLDVLMKIIDGANFSEDENFANESPQDKLKTIYSDSFEELWMTRNNFDCFIMADSEEFQVHKIVLAAHSPIFEAMFQEEKNKNEIVFKGFSPKAMEEALKFMYTKESPTPANALDVFKIAQKAKISQLKAVCEEIIVQNVDESNGYKVFAIGFRYESEKMKHAAFEVIKTMHPEKNLTIDSIEGVKELFMPKSLKRKISKNETRCEKNNSEVSGNLKLKLIVQKLEK